MKAVFSRNVYILNWACEEFLSEKSRTKEKNDAGVIHTCIIIWLPNISSSSIIELQSQLYVSWRLGAGDLAHCRSQGHVRCVVLDMVEGVDEVGSELQPESLGNREVLMQAEVNIVVVRRT